MITAPCSLNDCALICVSQCTLNNCSLKYDMYMTLYLQSQHTNKTNILDHSQSLGI